MQQTTDTTDNRYNRQQIQQTTGYKNTHNTANRMQDEKMIKFEQISVTTSMVDASAKNFERPPALRPEQ